MSEPLQASGPRAVPGHRAVRHPRRGDAHRTGERGARRRGAPRRGGLRPRGNMRPLRCSALGRRLPGQRAALSVAPRPVRRADRRGGEPALSARHRHLAGGPRGIADPDGRAPRADRRPERGQERAFLGADRRRGGCRRRLRGAAPSPGVRRAHHPGGEGWRGLADRPPQPVQGRPGGKRSGRVVADPRRRVLHRAGGSSWSTARSPGSTRERGWRTWQMDGRSRSGSPCSPPAPRPSGFPSLERTCPTSTCSGRFRT
jgi:hypothetical protein